MMQWIKRSEQEPEKKDDCSERYLAWNGRWMTIIWHGYDIVEESGGGSVWQDANGDFDFTHWAFLPDPPTASPEA